MLLTVNGCRMAEFDEMRIPMFSAVPSTRISLGVMSDPSNTKLSHTISSQYDERRSFSYSTSLGCESAIDR
jgi:hypothetical protein